MSSSPNETEPLIPRGPAACRKATFVWLVPVVALASLCRPSTHAALLQSGWSLGLTVFIQTWGVWASFLVSFLSVGWWSSLGDRRGRKIVLLASILGTVFLDLMYLIVASTAPSAEDAQDLLSVGLIIEGFLGGFASYNGAVHAYAFDVASTPVSRPVLFGLIDALSFVRFVLGAIIGKFTRYNISYILSVLIALGNLAFIYAFLPESLENQDRARPLVPQRSVFKSIFSPISVFFRNTGSYKSLPLFGLAFYVFSLTSAMETTLLRWTHGSPFLPGLLGWLLLTAPRVLDLATLVCILPGITWYWQRKHGTTSRAALHPAASLSHNALLLAAASCTGVLVFSIPHTSQALYAFFAPLYTPAATAAGPAFYALGAGYFAALGRGGEMGSLFGALAIWASWGCICLEAIFWETAFYLIVALMLLLPDAPHAQRQDEEEIAPGDAHDGNA
ncbi:hypothetical protein B0H14DRAFT_3577518 [Mycena olivaceomarginata]|nr:hypothetical protein B0H14DRAFT_3577518 [Mycena olivaceomarginata]